MENPTLAECRAVYLTAEDLRVAASIIYNAYHDDPFFTHIFKKQDIAAYEQKLRAMIREELNELWQQEQPLIGWFEDERLIGVACVVTHQIPVGEGRYWHWRLKMLLGAGWKSTQELMNKESCLSAHLPTQKCGILQFIAISPSEQKKGHGTKLIQAVLSWCDEQTQLDGIGVFATDESHKHVFVEQGFSRLTPITIGEIDGDLLFYAK